MVTVNPSYTVAIEQFTIENGNVTTTSGRGGGIFNNGGTLDTYADIFTDNSAAVGGGINNYVSGTLTAQNDTFTGNRGEGTGIWNAGIAATVTNSTFSGNVGGNGAGIWNYEASTLTVSGSTFTDNLVNSGSNFGDGGSALYNYGNATITNSTFYGNTSLLTGGAIVNVDNTLTITNSTIADNEGGYGQIFGFGPITIGATIVAESPPGTVFDCFQESPPVDLGYNLDDDGSCQFTASTDLPDTNPLLDPAGLQNNGGPTQTVALESGSPAVGHVSNASLCPVQDQRGFLRGVPCDIGAYEHSPTPTTTTLTSSADPSSPGEAVTFTASVSPVPDGGFVIFTDEGQNISACSTAGLNTTTGLATCTVTYTTAGQHGIGATYVPSQVPISQGVLRTVWDNW